MHDQKKKTFSQLLKTQIRHWSPDSPGCPSPTDSEVNMKEPSSSRSPILYFFYRISCLRSLWVNTRGEQFQKSWECVFLLVPFNRGMTWRCAANAKSMTPNSKCVSTCSNIYMGKGTHTHTHTNAHTHTHTVLLHGAVHSWRGGAVHVEWLFQCVENTC